MKNDTHSTSDAWISTYRGERFDLYDPKPEQIHLEDIAHALSNICRFGGHTAYHYSVAQHSLNVAQMMELSGALVEHILAGLLHDAAEAYIGDMVTPLKRTIPEFERLDGLITERILSRFGLEGWTKEKMKEAVDKYDAAMLFLEASRLRRSPEGRIPNWSRRYESAYREVVERCPWDQSIVSVVDLAPMTQQEAKLKFLRAAEGLTYVMGLDCPGSDSEGEAV